MLKVWISNVPVASTKGQSLLVFVKINLLYNPDEFGDPSALKP